MRRWIKRLVIAGIALGTLGLLVAASGIVPIKASSGHWAITEWILRFGMKRSVATHSLNVNVPENLADPALVQMGAGFYEMGCRSCHGEPGRSKPRIAEHMLPTPPELGPRIRESNAKKLFYIVKHGMKFTGMPAWPSEHRDDEVWAMVAFLLQYPELDSAAYRRLAGRDEAGTTSPDDSGPQPALPTLLQSCAKCHGRDGLGRGNAWMPNLAGQREAYLRRALEAYANGHRHSGMMEPVAGALTSEEIVRVAQYFASQPAGGRSTATTGATPDAVRRGELIANEGIRAQRVPACVECHGPGASRGKPEYPRLAGQPAKYLEAQLTLFREARRGGSDHAHLMQPIASRLKPEQARDVAAYFASLAAESSGSPAR
jgi:cytochrome c553